MNTVGALLALYNVWQLDDLPEAANDPVCEDDDDVGCDEWLNLLNDDYNNILELERRGGRMELAKKQHNQMVSLFCQNCASKCKDAKRF